MHPTTRAAFVIALAFTITALITGAIALADDTTPYPVQVVPVPSAPIAMPSCKSVFDVLGPIMTFTIANRTRHQLLKFTVRVKEYDSDNTPIGGGDIERSLDQPLAAGDTNVYTALRAPMPGAEGLKAISRITCRVESAEFTGRRAWAYGQKWPEPLEPLGAADGE